MPGSGAVSGPEGAAEPSTPFAGVGVVPGYGATPTLASPAPDTVPGFGAASGPEGATEALDTVPGFGAVFEPVVAVGALDTDRYSTRFRTCACTRFPFSDLVHSTRFLSCAVHVPVQVDVYIACR